MPLPVYREIYTHKDWQQWEGDWELVDGVPYAMSPSPSVTHQWVLGKVTRHLSESLDNCRFTYVFYGIDWHIGEKTVVRPDCLVICYDPGQRITRRPDLIFEIISESTAGRDEILKMALYRDEGVPWYVMAYPGDKKAKCYELINGEYRKVADFQDEVHPFTLAHCTIDFDFGYIWPK